MGDRIPTSIDGQLSYYSFDTATAITAGTWEAVESSMNVALSGAQKLLTHHEGAVFSLCRPIGHHAASDYFGGYCYLNNAAIAAQYLRDQGAERVAVGARGRLDSLERGAGDRVPAGSGFRGRCSRSIPWR